jgi:hypothetical protein
VLSGGGGAIDGPIKEVDMKRSSRMLVVLIFTGLLVSIAGAASASETDWRIYMRASTVGYTNYNSSAYVGTQSNATNEYDSGGIDAAYTATTGNQASVVSYEPTYPHYPPFYTKNLKAPILHHVPSWDLIIWTTSGWSTDTALNTVRLSIWSNSTYTPPSTVGGAPMPPYSFRIVWDPTGTYQPGTRWDFTPGATGTSTEPVFYIDFNNGHLIRSADATAMDQGIRIHLEPVPAEPTSLLALAGGLAGMGGVMWRKYKR